MEDYELQTEQVQAPDTADDTLCKYLLFRSDALLFGAAADYVVEIITNHPITPIPLVPSYVCGIINLRGQIIPIVDIRIMLGQMPTNRDCIIILTINGMLVGVLVDTVLRMIDLDTATLCMSPAKEHQRLVSGMCSLPDGETMLEFDCANLLTQA
ncbi:MAG TPA: purine-binding chemotaxis protein CheW [Candidatus Avoscillospira avistercoris]|uniref:Purine-binding chemotaxis protein CheW n=1 Tax=Candidatus Avoscillospira avistercoris TaxID=2840707 RepID=A0A9D1F8W4_9FIRM|nr:purine-binding chemotaxis protein CheW [Candidatus Avoscillospira avistercoris]